MKMSLINANIILFYRLPSVNGVLIQYSEVNVSAAARLLFIAII